MTPVTIRTTDPIISVLAEQRIDDAGVLAMAQWVAHHRPECVPTGHFDSAFDLLPHDAHDIPHALPGAWADRALSHNEVLCEIAGRKCLAASTLVLTSFGPRFIGAVEVGSSVVVDSETHRVTSCHDNGEQEVVAVVTRAGYALVCTPDHLIATEDGWIEAQNLKPGNVLRMNEGTGIWPGQGNLEEGYACGLFLGDGTFAGDGFLVANLRLFGDKRIAMSHVERLLQMEARPYLGGKALSINSKSWGQALAGYGVVHGLRAITSQIECASSDFQRGVLMGYFDSDGSLEVSKRSRVRRVTLSSSNRENLAAAQRMLINFGIYSRINKDKDAQESLMICGVKTHGKASWKLTISGQSLKLFAERIGSRRRTAELCHAVESAKRWGRQKPFGEVLAVRPAGRARVFDISVEGVHAFGANGIVAHNCYDSFSTKAGKKTNREYFEHITSMDPLHASIMYHAKMTFFFAGVSRKFSHQFIRNYVGSDRDEEGCPSQESTRFTHHYGWYIVPPLIVESGTGAIEIFRSDCVQNYADYRHTIERLTRSHPKAKRKEIYEAAAGVLNMSAETSFVWTTNPMAIRKFLKERCHEAADAEIDRFARKLARISFERWPNLFLGKDLDGVRERSRT